MNALKEILVVDDEPGYRALINKELKTAGYHTVLAQNGEEALVALWEKQQIGLVLLDVRLPVINGLNIFEIIRKDFPDKKIIVTSVLQKDEQRFLIYDADDYYDKSHSLSSLIEKVNNTFISGMKGILRENDKRNFRRMPVNVLASCEKEKHGPFPSCSHFISYTKDLSPFGGRFMVGEDIKVGQHFSMALELPVNFLPLLIDCEVVWVRKFEEFDSNIKGCAEVGVRFVKLDSPRDEEKLKNYLNCV
jgi:CheY-like chemotaxis protein